jgi:hypothetical protein
MIPNCRVSNAIKLVECSFQELQTVVQKYRGRPIVEGGYEVAEVNRYFEQFEEDLIKLVYLDNTQLGHPYVRHYLLSWPNNKDFLRKLHRGLEVGVRRQITERELIILAAIYDGQETRRSLRQIQRSLGRKGLVPHMSYQAFHKLATKLLASRHHTDFYSKAALPKGLDKIESEFWTRAADNLKRLRDSSEHREVIEAEIKNKSERREKISPQKKPK